MTDLDFSDQRHPGYQGSDPTKVKLSVIIPAYNEGERIKPTLEDVDKYLEKQPYMYEIIVVDNGSTDNTAQIVKSYRDSVEHSAVWTVPEPCPGKGCAVQRGIAQARGNYVLFMDADNATRITEIEKMWPKFEEGYDVVICSRAHPDSEIPERQSWIRETAGKMGNLLIRIFAVPGVKDTQCGFKAFTKKAARDIFSVVTIERWGFDIEVLALAKKFGYKIAETPVTWKHVEGDLITGGSYVSTFKDLFKVWWGLITGKYTKLREQSTERWRCLQEGKEPTCKIKPR